MGRADYREQLVLDFGRCGCESNLPIEREHGEGN